MGHEFEELPPPSLILGGEESDKFLRAIAIVFMLVFSYGMVDRYMYLYDLDLDFAEDKKLGDCIHYVDHKYGPGYSEHYNTSEPIYIECVDYVNEYHHRNISYTWWQDARDAEAQAILDSISSGSEGDGDHSGYVWTEGGVAQMAVYAGYFGQNMSVYGDPAPGDEFSSSNLGTSTTFDDNSPNSSL